MSFADNKLNRHIFFAAIVGILFFSWSHSASVARAAITFVAHKESTVTASSITLTQDDTGNDNLIVTAILGSTGDSLSSVKHAGRDENFIASRSTGGNRFLYLYYATSSTALVNATTTVTFNNGSDYHEIRQTQYEGVLQSDPFDFKNDASFPSDTSSTFSVSDNSAGDWMVMGTQNNGGFQPTTCLNCDIHSVLTNESVAISDSSSTGSFDMSVRWSTAAASNAIMAAFRSIGNKPSLSQLNQYQSDATTTITAGGTTTESVVVFGAKLQSAGTSTLQLQVETEPVGVSFINTANATSSFVSTGSIATTPAITFAPGSYHWQARVLENGTNSTSTWQLFGPNSSSVDFVVDPADSAYFDGSSAWKWPIGGAAFNSTDPFTIEFWYKTGSTSTMQLIDTRTNGYNGISVSSDATGINFSLNCGGNADVSYTSSSVHLAAAGGFTGDNFWHPVAITKATTVSSTDAFKLYFDTVQQTGSGKCYTSTSTDSIWIGGNPSSSVGLFNGKMDEVRIWNVERSSSSVRTYYNQEINPTSTGLVGYWRFNGTSTNLITGDSPSGHNGNPVFSSTSTPFGHFLLGYSSVSGSLLHYYASTTYSGVVSSAVATWNGNPQQAIVVTSTASTSSADLWVSDGYATGTFANVYADYCPGGGECIFGTSTKDTIFLNTFALASSTASGTQNTITHELGHALGLGHSWYGNVMNYYQTQQTYLGPQDIKDYHFLWNP